MNPSGMGVTSYVVAVTSSVRGNRRALEFPALKTLAVIALMCLQCIYTRPGQVGPSYRCLLLRANLIKIHGEQDHVPTWDSVLHDGRLVTLEKVTHDG